MREVEGWLGRADLPEPFCLVVSLVNPHDVLGLPRSYVAGGYTADEFARPRRAAARDDRRGPARQADDPGDDEDRPDVVSRGAVTGRSQQRYVAFYAHLHRVVDRKIGRLLTALGDADDPQSLRTRTVVLRTSDHGELGLSHGGLRQKMFNAYEESIRVPFVVSSPALFDEPRESDALVSLVDIVPTLVGLSGRPLADGALHGRDLGPVLSGESDGVRDTVLFTYDDHQAGTAFQDAPGQPNRIRCVRDAAVQVRDLPRPERAGRARVRALRPRAGPRRGAEPRRQADRGGADTVRARCRRADARRADRAVRGDRDRGAACWPGPGAERGGVLVAHGATGQRELVLAVDDLDAGSALGFAERALVGVEAFPALVVDDLDAAILSRVEQLVGVGGRRRQASGDGVLDQEFDGVLGALLVRADDARRTALDPARDVDAGAPVRPSADRSRDRRRCGSSRPARRTGRRGSACRDSRSSGTRAPPRSAPRRPVGRARRSSVSSLRTTRTPVTRSEPTISTGERQEAQHDALGLARRRGVGVVGDDLDVAPRGQVGEVGVQERDAVRVQLRVLEVDEDVGVRRRRARAAPGSCRRPAPGRGGRGRRPPGCCWPPSASIA